MLEKISNIKLNTNLSDSKKKPMKNRYLNSVMREYREHDELDISNGLRALYKHKVKLNRFKVLEKRSLEISFIYSDIEFNTTLNLEYLSNYTSLRYRIRHAGDKPSYAVFMNTKTLYGEDSLDKSLPAKSLKYLLERIDSLDVKAELNSKNTRALSNLFDNIYNGILDEFIFLNSLIYKVVSDVMDVVLKKEYEESLENELILIEKIIPENAD